MIWRINQSSFWVWCPARCAPRFFRECLINMDHTRWSSCSHQAFTPRDSVLTREWNDVSRRWENGYGEALISTLSMLANQGNWAPALQSGEVCPSLRVFPKGRMLWIFVFFFFNLLMFFWMSLTYDFTVWQKKKKEKKKILCPDR